MKFLVVFHKLYLSVSAHFFTRTVFFKYTTLVEFIYIKLKHLKNIKE